jgi:FkbM family methyltransferase
MRPGKRLIWSLFKKAMPLFEDEKILTLLVARSPTDTDADLLGKLEFHAVHDNLTGSSPDTVEPSLSPGLLALWLTSLSGSGRMREIRKRIQYSVTFPSTNCTYEMEVRLNHSPECLFWCGVPQKHLLTCLARSRRKTRMVDVGAHIGSATLPASFLFQEVVALEPCAATFGRLQLNLAINRRENVLAIHTGAGSKEGEDWLTFAEGQSGGASLQPENNRKHRERIRLTTLDALISGPVDFVKVDTEGWDLEVLRGASRILRDHQPDLFLELGSADQVLALRNLLPASYQVAYKGGWIPLRQYKSKMMGCTDLYLSTCWT